MSYSGIGEGFRSLISRLTARGLFWGLAGLLVVPGIAKADTLRYTWLEGGYQRYVPGSYSGASSGEFVAGSYALTDQFDLHGDYYDQGSGSIRGCGTQIQLTTPPTYITDCYDYKLKNHGYRLGLGWHEAITDGVDFIAGLDYESETGENSATLVSSSSSNSPPPVISTIVIVASAYPLGHSTGGRGYVGVRADLAPRLELDGVLGHLHVGGGAASLPASAYNFLDGTAVFSITQSWAGVFDWTHQYLSGVQANTYRLGLRFVF